MHNSRSYNRGSHSGERHEEKHCGNVDSTSDLALYFQLLQRGFKHGNDYGKMRSAHYEKV